jgi:hypothetical protein
LGNQFFLKMFLVRKDLKNSSTELANFSRNLLGVLWTISFQASWTSGKI